jgi:hypothetical protein
MGRELVQNLANELVRTGYDDEAKHAVTFLEKPDDRSDSFRVIAVAQARRGDMPAALGTVEEIEDPSVRNKARLAIANVLNKDGQPEAARELADVVWREWKGEQGGNATLGRSLAALYAKLRCQSKLKDVITDSRTPESKTDRILWAIRGIADSMAE